MIVRSLSREHMWFEDFAAFARLPGPEVDCGKLLCRAPPSGRPLHHGWATGAAELL